MSYNPYSAPTLTGYNATPPSDDAAETANNTVEWAKHKDKLGDPLKNYSAAVSSAVSSAFGALPFIAGLNAQSTTYTVQTSDAGKIISCTGTFTVTLLAAATAKAGFTVMIENVSTGLITIDGDGTETINGQLTTLVSPGQTYVLRSDASNWRSYQFNPRHNLQATTAPAVTDDTDLDFSPGSFWADTTNDNAYICLDATDGEAVWISIGNPSVAIICDQKAQNTDGGTFTSGADRTRDLNTEIFDTDGIVSIGSDQFTIPTSGTYMIEWSAPAQGVNDHQTLLYDITGAAELTRGTSASSSGSSTTRSFGAFEVTISASNTYEIRHRCTTTQATAGFGAAGNFGVERYTMVKIERTG